MVVVVSCGLACTGRTGLGFCPPPWTWRVRQGEEQAKILTRKMERKVPHTCTSTLTIHSAPHLSQTILPYKQETE